MCLDRLKKFKLQPTHTDGSVMGWKLLWLCSDGKLYPEYHVKVFPEGYKPGIWHVAKRRKIKMLETDVEESYPNGFHICMNGKRHAYYRNRIFRRRNSILRWVPVYFMPDDVLATGIDNILKRGSYKNIKCVVSKRMYIDPDDYAKAVK